MVADAVGLNEHVEHFRDQVRFQSNPVVFDLDPHQAGFLRYVQFDPPTPRQVLGSVRQNGEEYLGKAGGIAISRTARDGRTVENECCAASIRG